MGCFPACLGQLRRNLTTKRVQHQCLSQSNEQHESMKKEPEKVEAQKEEEIINPIKQLIMAESEDKHEETKMDGNGEENLKKVADELVEKANSDAEKEAEEGKDYESGSNRIRESAVKDHSHHQELFLLNEKECSHVHVQEESCSSLFSLSIDSRRQVYASEMGGEREVSSQMKTRNNTSLKNDDEEKENVATSKDNVIEQRFEKSKAIETSLLTWLVESREMSGGSSSPESENNYGDRQILGVISSNADVNKVESSSNCLIDSEA